MAPSNSVIPNWRDCLELPHTRDAFAVEVFEIRWQLTVKLLTHMTNDLFGIVSTMATQQSLLFHFTGGGGDFDMHWKLPTIRA